MAFSLEHSYNPEKPKNNLERLKGFLGVIAQEINTEMGERYGMGDFVNKDCSVNMDSFASEKGGIYAAYKVSKDKEDVKALEYEFAGVNNPSWVKHLEENERVTGPEAIVSHWKKGKERMPSGKMELAVTSLLYKMLKKEFVVVKTSALDDYKGHMDNILLNKETGDVVAAFDEVHDQNPSDRIANKPTRTEEKKKKTENIAKSGGGKVEYGIAMEHGKIKRSRLENVPVFYLSLNASELEGLLDGMSYDSSTNITAAEHLTFAKLVGELEEQKRELEKLPLRGLIKDNLLKFGATLERFKKIATMSYPPEKVV